MRPKGTFATPAVRLDAFARRIFLRPPRKVRHVMDEGHQARTFVRDMSRTKDTGREHSSVTCHGRKFARANFRA